MPTETRPGLEHWLRVSWESPSVWESKLSREGLLLSTWPIGFEWPLSTRKCVKPPWDGLMPSRSLHCNWDSYDWDRNFLKLLWNISCCCQGSWGWAHAQGSSHHGQTAVVCALYQRNELHLLGKLMLKNCACFNVGSDLLEKRFISLLVKCYAGSFSWR